MKPGVRQPNELKVFFNFLYISLALADFLLIMIIIQKRVNFNRCKFSIRYLLEVLFACDAHFTYKRNGCFCCKSIIIFYFTYKMDGCLFYIKKMTALVANPMGGWWDNNGADRVFKRCIVADG
ncbi:hypothetical protein S83_001797 [Arachis hypogaea]